VCLNTPTCLAQFGGLLGTPELSCIIMESCWCVVSNQLPNPVGRICPAFEIPVESLFLPLAFLRGCVSILAAHRCVTR
jgi:hypothetical protein